MLNNILKWLGWKTLSGRWDKREIVFDVVTVAVIAVCIVAYGVLR